MCLELGSIPSAHQAASTAQSALMGPNEQQYEAFHMFVDNVNTMNCEKENNVIEFTFKNRQILGLTNICLRGWLLFKDKCLHVIYFIFAYLFSNVFMLENSTLGFL